MEIFDPKNLPEYEVGKILSIDRNIGCYIGKRHFNMINGLCSCGGSTPCADVVIYEKDNRTIIRKAFLKPNRSATSFVTRNGGISKKLYERYDNLLSYYFQEYLDSLPVAQG